MMISRFAYAGCLVIGLSAAGISQGAHRSGAELCSERRMKEPATAMDVLSQNTPFHSFDVLNYTLNLDIYNCFRDPYPKSYSGYEIITFTVDSTLSSIQLNAVNASLGIDTIVGKTFVQAGDIFTINLGSTYHAGDTLSAVIYYHHNNVADNAFYAANGMVFTDCEPEGARKWFPCWDRPSDKATLDLTAKVPLEARLGSNGRLVDSVCTGDTTYYHWASRDPIATYLMVMTGKMQYNLDKEYWKKTSNPNDSIPVLFYWNAGENTAQLKDIEAKVPLMATYYSSLFGEYPFEKIGMATIARGAGFVWGGMENQTLISLEPNTWNEDLVSHEFAHHWFGDMISPGTWADVWLNEGFATYCEALWDESTGGYGSYKNAIVADADGYLGSNPGWPIYNPTWAVATPGLGTMFNTAITYDKGACVLHMLRYTLGDSLFFACIKAYTTDTASFRLKNAVTADFVQKMSSVAGEDLSWFFNEWVMQPNHPVYHNVYTIDSAAKSVHVILQQTQQNPPFFKMPVELMFSFANSPDSTIRVMDSTNGQEFSFTFADRPTYVVFDPNDNIVLKVDTSAVTGAPQRRTTAALHYSLDQNYPNPFNPSTNLRFTVAEIQNVTLKIYDVLGKEVATLLNTRLNPGQYTVQWDGSGAASGVYFYRLQAGSFDQTRKLLLMK